MSMPTMRKTPGMAQASTSLSFEPKGYEVRGDGYEGTAPKAEISIFVNTTGMEWRQYAACIGSKLQFVPSNYGGPTGDTANVRACKALCETCPVSWECLQMALESDDKNAICGGYTPKERKELKLWMEQ